MEFEVGKLYVTENNEHTDGCVFEYVGVGRDLNILKFNIIKTNEHFKYCNDFRIERRNVATFGFKPLIQTKDDIHECIENNQKEIEEKLWCLKDYCDHYSCDSCVFKGLCHDWEIYENGKLVLLEDNINKDYKKLRSPSKKAMAFDEIKKASHYNQGIEAIEYIESHNMNFDEGNVIKYVTRAKYKGTYIKDLEKARYYLDRLIQKGETND